jgi:hypothetical protein
VLLFSSGLYGRRCQGQVAYRIDGYSVIGTDTTSGQEIARIEIGDRTFAPPCGLVSTGNHLFSVEMCGGSTVVVIDATRHIVVGRIGGLPCCLTGAVDVSSDGRVLYLVTEEFQQQDLLVLNTATHEIVRSITLSEGSSQALTIVEPSPSPPASLSPTPTLIGNAPAAGGCSSASETQSTGLGPVLILFALLLRSFTGARASKALVVVLTVALASPALGQHPVFAPDAKMRIDLGELVPLPPQAAPHQRISRAGKGEQPAEYTVKLMSGILPDRAPRVPASFGCEWRLRFAEGG